ncbi:MAG: hypothetical protein AB1420_01370 [Bacillota bacterium]
MANNISWHRSTTTRLYRIKIFAMLGYIFIKQLFVIKLLWLLNKREPVYSMLTVLGTIDILLSIFQSRDVPNNKQK